MVDHTNVDLDVNALLATATVEELQDIQEYERQIIVTLTNLQLGEEIPIEKFVLKLAGYRVIHHLYQLRRGRFIRWIRRGESTLKSGGILTDIKYTDKGVNLVLKIFRNRILQIRFDDCVFFQQYNLFGC